MSPTGPGGPHMSSAKKRRLMALEQRNGGGSSNKKQLTSIALPGDTKAVVSPAFTNNSENDNEPKKNNHTRVSNTYRQTAGDGVYERLPDVVLSGPVAKPLGLTAATSQLTQSTRAGDLLSTMLEQLMSTNTRSSDSKTIVNGKLRDKTLLLENPTISRGLLKRNLGGPILTAHFASKKKQRQLGLYNLKTNPQNITFESLQDVHRQWQSYVHSLALPAENLKEAQQLLFEADLHGCLLHVVSCSSQPRFAGTRGIVIRNSTNTFSLVTPGNQIVVVPKRSCVFEYAVDTKRVVRLRGDALLEKMKNR